MSDPTPPIVVADPDSRGEGSLTPESIDALLADFRAWLEAFPPSPHRGKGVGGEGASAFPPSPLRGRGAGGEGADPLSPSESLGESPFDIATVLQHFTALRHEINLQTKASRNQLEQNSQLITMLQESLGTLQRQENQLEDWDRQAQDEVIRPLLKTLIDAHDALALAERQVRRMLERTAAPEPTAASVAAPPVIKLRLPHWARWLGLDASVEAQLAPLYAWHATQPAPVAESPDRYRQSIDGLLTGYVMSRERIERALEQHGLEAITCVGAPFDPEVMEVADVVREPGRTSTVVLEELRRGYTWRGKLFRYAQVRVAKP